MQLQRDRSPDDSDDLAAARVIVTTVHQLVRAIRPYRRRVFERLEHDYAGWLAADGE